MRVLLHEDEIEQLVDWSKIESDLMSNCESDFDDTLQNSSGGN